MSANCLTGSKLIRRDADQKDAEFDTIREIVAPFLTATEKGRLREADGCPRRQTDTIGDELRTGLPATGNNGQRRMEGKLYHDLNHDSNYQI